MIEGVRRLVAARTEKADPAVPGAVLSWTNPNEMSMCKAWEPDRSRRSNLIFNPPVHQHVACAVTYTYD